jgi:hypothetical protein
MTSTPDLAAIAPVESAGTWSAKRMSLARAAQDPHYIEAKPSFMLDRPQGRLVHCRGPGAGDWVFAAHSRRCEKTQHFDECRGYLDVSSRVEKLEVPGVDVEPIDG